MKEAGSKNPLVSLAIPVYNGEAYLVDAITSCLAQDYDNFELIISDNASTDGTERICREFATKDARVKYFRNEKNLGAGRNYNLAFHHSSGKYMKWCAADDRISPNFVSACVAVLEKNHDVILAYGTTISIDTAGREIPLVGRGRKAQDPNDGPAKRFLKDLNDRGSNFECFGLFRREILQKSTLHRSYYGSDLTLMSELTLLGRFAQVPEAIFYNREHPARSMNLKDKKVLLAWQDPEAATKHRPRPENWDRWKHLLEIAFRHRQTTPALAILAVIVIWTTARVRDRIAVTLRQMTSGLFKGHAVNREVP